MTILEEPVVRTAPLPPETPWFTIEHTVTAGDTSAVGPVYYARLIDWQGQCRERAGMAGAPLFSSDISGDYAMLTQSCSCEYFKELYYGDLVAIRLTVRWVRLHLMKAEFRYHRIDVPGQPDGDLVARGEQMWASASLVDGHYEPCPWPREMADCAAQFGADLSRAQIQDPPNYRERRTQR
ncbi:acyl-CoA thioesterase [Actinocrispum wychmicini]|uniref:Enediyne biosynthesis thioesterase n=1 Tax=Actinocrispum wychmicini TaxID=1213861 RepID=A0A4R2ISW3_9PSEU|nr:acyl-CoA thioesterase [Actinocrispum wychmicini]TCO45905.1 enediyne biosynthesis thioesterase [Actinocrispum wychmicini]